MEEHLFDWQRNNNKPLEKLLESGTETEKYYIEQAIKVSNSPIEDIVSITVTDMDDPETLDIAVKTDPVKFDRIRRITGYLTGTVDRWNNAKRAELKDRTKSSLENL